MLSTQPPVFNPLPKLWYGKTKDIYDLWVLATDTTGTYFLGYVFMPPTTWSPVEVQGKLAEFAHLRAPETRGSDARPTVKSALLLTCWDWFLQLPLNFTHRGEFMHTIDKVLTLAQSPGSIDQALMLANDFEQTHRLAVVARTPLGSFSTCNTLRSDAIRLAEEQLAAVALSVDVAGPTGPARASAGGASLNSTASSTTSPLDNKTSGPVSITINVIAARDKLQSSQWQICCSLRSASSLVAGQVFHDLQPHDDIRNIRASFHHVLLKNPLFITVLISEPHETGDIPVAAGVLNLSSVLNTASAVCSIKMCTVQPNTKRGWGTVFESLSDGALKHSSQLKSLDVAVSVAGGTLASSLKASTGQSFILDSFNPQDRIVLSCNNFILTSEEHHAVYYVKVRALKGVVLNNQAHKSVCSFPVKNGQSLGLTVEISGNLEDESLQFEVYRKTGKAFVGTCKLKGLQDGGNTVALTNSSLFVGYIKLNARILNSTVSYQPTLDKLLSGGSVAAISLLSQSTVVQFFRALFTRILSSFLQEPNCHDSVVALNKLCEVNDRVGYLFQMYVEIEEIPDPALLGHILQTLASNIADCSASVHRTLPQLISWLVPHSDSCLLKVSEFARAVEIYVQDGPPTAVIAVLQPFVSLLLSLRPMVPAEQLVDFFDQVISAINTFNVPALNLQKYLMLSQLASTSIFLVGNFWMRVIQWTKPAWASDDLQILRSLASLLRCAAIQTDKRFDAVSDLIPLLLKLLAGLVTMPAACVAGKLFDTAASPQLAPRESRGLLVCELTLVLGLLLERCRAADVLDKTESRRYCLDTLRVVTSLIEVPVFPKRWISLYALQLRIAVMCLVHIQPILPGLASDQGTAAELDIEINSKYLTVCIKLCSLSLLSTHLLFPGEEILVAGIMGDSFNQCLGAFCEAWRNLGDYDNVECAHGYQITVINGAHIIVQHLMQCLLQTRSLEAREKLGSILHSIIVPGYSGSDLQENQGILGLLLESLDRLFAGLSKIELPAPESIQQFTDALRIPDARITSILERFMNLSIGYYLYENLLTAGNVLRYCGDLKLMGLVEVYCSRICATFRNNFRVHGQLYMELAKLYSWNDFTTVSSTEWPRLPKQRAASRKKKLIMMAADCFTKAKEYTMAITAVKLLLVPAEALKDYKTLSTLSSKLQGLYSKAVTTPELVKHYYLVSFPDHRLPILSRKTFVLEGNELRIDEIRVALQSEYGIPCYIYDRGMKSTDCIYVRTVYPHVSNGEDTATAQIDSFYEATPLPGSTSVLDLHVEESVYRCFQSFPLVSGMSQVETVKTRVVSPLDTALKAVQDKVCQLKVILNKAIERSPGFEIQLEMALSGIITAPINGGVAMYQKFVADLQMELAFKELSAYVKLAIELYSDAITEDRRPQVDLYWSAYHHSFQSGLKV